MSRIRRAIADAGKLPSADPARNRLLGEISKQMGALRDDEEVRGRPGWVKSDRQMRQAFREHKRRTQPVLEKIKQRIDSETARAWDWNRELWIGCNRELTFVGFDRWYQRDEEMERDRSSGRRAELTSILQAAAREIASADSEVRFHSHQTVQEQCGGDYFRYLR